MKICGIRSGEEARTALACGTTALGFLIGLTHRAEDAIGAAEARAIVGQLPSEAEAVLVTHLRDPERVADLSASVGPGALEPACRRIRRG